VAPGAATVVIEADTATPVAIGLIDRIARDTVSALPVLRSLIVSIVPTIPAAGEIGKIDGAFPHLLPHKQTRKKVDVLGVAWYIGQGCLCDRAGSCQPGAMGCWTWQEDLTSTFKGGDDEEAATRS
jgi:hypothetical protein